MSENENGPSLTLASSFIASTSLTPPPTTLMFTPTHSLDRRQWPLPSHRLQTTLLLPAQTLLPPQQQQRQQAPRRVARVVAAAEVLLLLTPDLRPPNDPGRQGCHLPPTISGPAWLATKQQHRPLPWVGVGPAPLLVPRRQPNGVD